MKAESALELCDAHAHLNELRDIEEQLDEAISQGVRYIVGVGMDIESNKEIIEIGSRFSNVIVALGYHPWSVKDESSDQNIQFLKENINRARALGEIGLDYKAKAPKKVQQKVFEEIAQIGKEFQKPLIIHARYSHKRCFEIIKSIGIQSAIFHWYSGPVEVLKKIIDEGYFISVTPALSYSPTHREAASFAPIQHILLETDAPVEYEGSEARLVDILKSLKLLSELRGMSLEAVAEITSKNFKQIFDVEAGN